MKMQLHILGLSNYRDSTRNRDSLSLVIVDYLTI